MLKIRALSRSFGGIKAVDSVDLDIAKGSLTGVIGPNGAGKSTLFNLIAGTLSPDEGRMKLDGEDITGLAAHELFKRGLLRTFQIAHEFTSLTVLENLMAVPSDQEGESLWQLWLQPKKIKQRETKEEARAREVAEFLKLDHLLYEPAGNLSGGQKKLLELGRTMMVDAKIVLLDEVGAGVNRTLLKSIGEAILKLNQERGYTFVMIEHDIDFIASLCDPVVVMVDGRILKQGRVEDIRSDPEVIEAYLGSAGSAAPEKGAA